MPQVRRGTVARNRNARVLQRGAWSGTLPASPQGEPLNRWSGRGRGRERTQHDREETMRLVRRASISRDDRDRRYASFESDFLVEKHMGIDILPPIGFLVSPFGLILAAYGKFANSSRYPQSLTGRPLRGANIHFHWFTWGVVLLASGPLRVWLGRRGMRGVPQKSYSSGIIWPFDKEMARSPASR
jgi:hypothetical protein